MCSSIIQNTVHSECLDREAADRIFLGLYTVVTTLLLTNYTHDPDTRTILEPCRTIHARSITY